ncbi:MAG: phosphatidylserine decarboxylase family protein [Flavobacteriaceae bacterium]|jgi:phosphatidylserine decarboxylase|nr:phosphatidylserine decarboxylase family protein [Flavobacteriaceae bacterium]
MFHKEGFKIIIVTFLLTAVISIFSEYYIESYILKKPIQITSLFILILILQFFRNPKRKTKLDKNHIIAPADGKIVIIKEVLEEEYFKEKKLQVSIFMSPLNVHVTRYPISGKVVFSKYHPGKYLVAWHPKSSILNERTSIVVKNDSVGEILYRQIAGALARRIINYAKKDLNVVQGEDAGFIKFGSRIDLFLPVKSNVNVSIGQKVKGGITVITSKAS